MDLDLKGKVAFITGGGQGVGRRIATQLAEEWCKVAINDFFPERAEAVAAEIRTAGGQAYAAPADITNKSAIDAAIAGTVASLGPIDILVNNAGVTVDRRAKGGMAPMFLETGASDWENIIALNIWGMLHCCHAVLPGMRERRWGKIVNIMSEAGRAGEARLAVYSAAKAAMLGMTGATGSSADIRRCSFPANFTQAVHSRDYGGGALGFRSVPAINIEGCTFRTNFCRQASGTGSHTVSGP